VIRELTPRRIITYNDE